MTPLSTGRLASEILFECEPQAGVYLVQSDGSRIQLEVSNLFVDQGALCITLPKGKT